MLLLKRTVLMALSYKFLMTWIRLVLMLYFFMVAHKAACKKPVEGLLEVYELEIFLTEDS